MKVWLKNILLLFTMIVVHSGCHKVLNFQNGYTLGHKNRELMLYAHTTQPVPEFSSRKLPNIGIEARRGMTEKWDIGIGINTSQIFSVGSNIQLYGDRFGKYSCAIGPTAQLQFGNVLLKLPFTYSIRVNEKFGLNFYTMGNYHISDGINIGGSIGSAMVFEGSRRLTIEAAVSHWGNKMSSDFFELPPNFQIGVAISMLSETNREVRSGEGLQRKRK